MSEPVVKLHVHDHTGTITLNRPDKRNALTRQLLSELRQAFADLHLQKSVRAIVLTGAGSAFCAGMDLGEMLRTAEEPNSYELWDQDARLYREVLETMVRFPKPIIAAVDGPAVAGGAGLVLASDIVLASRQSKFGLPEPKRGLVAGIVSPLLAFRVGGSRAAYLLLTTRLIEAEVAQSYGLFHELTDSDTIWARAHELAGEIAQSAPEALSLTKRMLNETIGAELDTQLAAGAAVSSTARSTEAAAEGLAAFLEKRDPVWE
ncbi:MAG: enoyl-CoA hydratase/isomerase family protein [Planctomycetota bacterium]|nr:MAG: enoyl-CoA hydratase/isomerase family protein [Planctomycetota bacterium]REK39347.1 MAG: enoyl-CoA hydratase/isomerase family protein [Planctomycetota bacterium]